MTVLSITPVQLDTMANAGFLRRVRQFVLDRTINPALRKAASTEAGCYPLWNSLLPALKGRTEYDQVLRLVYALAAMVTEVDPVTALTASEFDMKQALEDWGMMRFSEFDL